LYSQMPTDTISALLELNHKFYQDFGSAFAATRRRIQPGIHRLLEEMPAGGGWLDIGCGSGTLAAAWAAKQPHGDYLGLDFSASLLEEARKTIAKTDQASAAQIKFIQTDLGDPDWPDQLEGRSFNGIMAFAVLHHLPGRQTRQRLMRQIRSFLKPGGLFYHSEWQFQHSPRLMARRQPWKMAGIDPEHIEPGDTLLDWRHALPGQAEKIGLRYVHLFDLDELNELAFNAGFKITHTFESDGREGRLGLYQVWQAC
jgi:tRNA (uracil-5-)-methyltransferase TRM9